jgi:hypothetical protein
MPGPANQRTSLSLGRAQKHNMAAYDRLPPDLRAWLAQAKLPWSPTSAQRAWRRALVKCWGRRRAALEMMDRIEAERLAKDALVQEREREIAAARARGPARGVNRGAAR